MRVAAILAALALCIGSCKGSSGTVIQFLEACENWCEFWEGCGFDMSRSPNCECREFSRDEGSRCLEYRTAYYQCVVDKDDCNDRDCDEEFPGGFDEDFCSQ